MSEDFPIYTKMSEYIKLEAKEDILKRAGMETALTSFFDFFLKILKISSHLTIVFYCRFLEKLLEGK